MTPMSTSSTHHKNIAVYDRQTMLLLKSLALDTWQFWHGKVNVVNVDHLVRQNANWTTVICI